MMNMVKYNKKQRLNSLHQNALNIKFAERYFEKYDLYQELR